MNLLDALDIHTPQMLDALSKEQLDQLPCGAIRVDAEGRILFYSRAQALLTHREPETVIGRNFFSELAPCTVVPEFFGRFRQGVLTGNLNTTFEFVFDFDMQPVQARISMRASEQADEFWILVEPLRTLPTRDEGATLALVEAAIADPKAGLTAVSFDFSQCDQEPIAQAGAIQPFGCLLVLDPVEWRIAACSANTEMYLGQPPPQLLGAPLEQALVLADGTNPHDLLSPGSQASPFCPALLRARAVSAELPLVLRPHHWRGRLLLEIEPDGEMDLDQRARDFNAVNFQQRLQQIQDEVQVCQEAVDALRSLSGFERVLVLRFEPDQDAIVIAESLQPGSFGSILGLRYPASDIPRQARALYRETLLRYAPSRDHSDIPLLHLAQNEEPIDIGIAHLGTLSPIHRNYLQCFGVNGSMSYSILLEGELWGLVVFHHRQPHPLTPYARLRLTELSGFLSARLALIEQRSSNRISEQGVAAVNAIVGDIDIDLTFPDNFAGKEQVLRDLVGADLVQVYHGGQPLFAERDFGLAAEDLEALLAFLRGRTAPLWSTDCLSGVFEPAARYPERLAGVMVVFIDERREDMLLFARRRVIYAVKWGADPASLPFLGKEEQLLGFPKRVFRIWQEDRTHHARPWSNLAIATGLALRNLIQQLIAAKSRHFERLSSRLARQRDRLLQHQEEIRRRALHDALHDRLTGLPNRLAFREALDQAIQVSRTTDHWFAMALLDIDHFKTINDTLGHDQGDSLLRGVAAHLAAVLPEDSLLARLGGDEFALLLHPTDKGFLELGNQVIEHLRQPILVGTNRFAITGSLGLTIGTGDADPGELLKQADLALYRAKEEGRNCARPFDQSLELEVLKRLEIDRAILGRSPAEAIEILLQPQIAINSPSRQRRFEVLARWRREDGSLLMPADMIAAAERNGTIRAVTDIVLAQAIGLLRQVQSEGEADVLFGVNLSAADLESPHFAHRLIEDLREAGIAPAQVELEITETMLLRLSQGVRDSMDRLVEAGIHLSLDDFGTGFSSMAYLRELPISIVKIDRAFIQGIERQHDRNLVAGMITMIHSIGKQVIAEGIETLAQLQLLAELGCDWGQGYYWSRPLPPNQALRRPIPGG